MSSFPQTTRKTPITRAMMCARHSWLANSKRLAKMTGAISHLLLSAACCLMMLSPAHCQALILRAPRSSHQDTGGNNHYQALNYLLFKSLHINQTSQQPQQQQQPQDDKLIKLLKDTSHSHASDTVDIKLANSVWAKMRANALEFAAGSVHQNKPLIDQLLEQSNISSKCSKSINDALDRMAKLDGWAIKMYNSIGGFLPANFFDGTHSSIGSYHQCLSIEPNDYIGAPQYCTLKFQPILPKRPRYHNILSPIENLANFTSQEDFFNGIAKKAQYFYYTKLRVATCVPNKCDSSDLNAIGEQIAVNTYLQYQGLECLDKPSYTPDGVQLFALSVLIGLAAISCLGTLVHILNLRSMFSVCEQPKRDRNRKQQQQQQQHVLKQLASIQVDLNANSKQANGIANNSNINSNSNNNNNNTISLNNNNNNHITHKQKSASILPTTVVQVGSSSSSVGHTPSLASARAVHAIDILLHFSIVKNARKLFDTSTSNRQKRTKHNSGPNHKCVHTDTTKIPSAACSSMSSVEDDETIDDTDSVQGSNEHQMTMNSRPTDISCVHGLRVLTMSWICLGHSLQYNEWSGFGSAYQVENNIAHNFLLHPFLNATFSVDTFFLISGLLTTYVTWTITRGQYWRFNKFAFLISRYLRLTPQVLIVMLIYIVFPLFGDGPFWRSMFVKQADNCRENWWIGALFLQAFYKQDKICNLVTWWLSVEMCFHFLSIFVIIALLQSTKKGLVVACALGSALISYSFYLHYSNSYPPNMMPTLLQRYEIWDSIVLKYFWTPYPHAPSYFIGLVLGYALYNRSIKKLNKRQVQFGWTLFGLTYLFILYGTYWWNNNAPYTKIQSAAYYNLAQIFWPLATGWAIIACVAGYGGWLNKFLSSPVFIPFSRSTYFVYLSHMLIVMLYPASMNLLIEPSYLVFLYIFISNLVLSYVLGIALTIVYESPILHLQKVLLYKMASNFNEKNAPKDYHIKRRMNTNNDDLTDADAADRVSLYTQQQMQQQSLNCASGQPC